MNIVVFVNPQQEINENWDAVITNMSEADKAGIEFALQLKEKKGGQVTAVAIGMEEADLALREALAMGVDHAALMSDGDVEVNVPEKIITALQKVGGDVFVTGRQDDVMEQVVESLQLARVQYREVGFDHASGFVFVSAEDFIPRHMHVAGVYAAYNKEVESIPAV